MRKALIIKTGYSETADKEIGRVSSLGDVLRTTVLLHKFKDDNVTWVTDEKAEPLLKGNPYIKRVFIWDVATAIQLAYEQYDIIINLEKVPGICALIANMDSKQKYGFYFDRLNGEAVAYYGSENICKITKEHSNKQIHGKKWQELLFEMIGEKYNGEEYILRIPKHLSTDGGLQFQVGLNFCVGSKWPTKAWPKKYWDSLRMMLIAKKYYWADQPEETNLEDYIKWINRCDLIVTNDSLGLHIALALRKKVIVLCGPTNTDEIDMYGRGIIMTAKQSCLFQPCLKVKCDIGNICMESILPEDVMKNIEEII
jgi:heptosyltransferase-2